MSGLTELLARVEAATGPDRELDRDIGFELAGWKLVEVASPNPRMMLEIDGDIYPNHPGAMYVSFTESIDQAFALVERLLPGWGHQVGRPLQTYCNGYYASVFRERLSTEHGTFDGHFSDYPHEEGLRPRDSYRPNGAIAILAALLRALISRTPATGGKP